MSLRGTRLFGPGSSQLSSTESNILLDENDFAYLIDFGIPRAVDETRMTKSGNAIGTFQYIAPERLGSRAGEDARAYPVRRGAPTRNDQVTSTGDLPMTERQPPLWEKRANHTSSAGRAGPPQGRR